MKNFTRFSKHFLDYAMAKEYGLTDDYGADPDTFTKNIVDSIKHCHIFETTEPTKRLLALTKTPNKNDMFKLPFGCIFIDVCFKKEEMKKLNIDIGYNEIIGIIVRETNLISRDTEVKVATALRITILSVTDGRVWFDTFNKNVNLLNEYKDYNFKIQQFDQTNPNARRFIHCFVLNFLNFLNNPEVSYKHVEYDTKRNLKRIKNGKAPIPSREIIKINGVLKKYISTLSKDNKIWDYHYRFWVRGHFRTLRAERYGSNIGKRMWILPYIKGQGVLIEKEYKLTKKEDKQMDNVQDAIDILNKLKRNLSIMSLPSIALQIDDVIKKLKKEEIK